jgi:hypothetical protein
MILNLHGDIVAGEQVFEVFLLSFIRQVAHVQATLCFGHDIRSQQECLAREIFGRGRYLEEGMVMNESGISFSGS